MSDSENVNIRLISSILKIKLYFLYNMTVNFSGVDYHVNKFSSSDNKPWFTCECRIIFKKEPNSTNLNWSYNCQNLHIFLHIHSNQTFRIFLLKSWCWIYIILHRYSYFISDKKAIYHQFLKYLILQGTIL